MKGATNQDAGGTIKRRAASYGAIAVVAVSLTACGGDGDLHYSIELDGNYLRSTAGDEGYVSGRFVGERHEGAVGILEHPDLAAGWGALR